MATFFKINRNSNDYHNGMFNETSFYQYAFEDTYLRIWEKTPHAAEVKELAFLHSLVIFGQSSNENETDRRKLLYNYCKPYVSVIKKDDILNKIQSVLPSKNIAVKRVINAICKLYENTPSRLISKNEIEETQLSDLIKNSEYDVIMSYIHKLCKLVNECIVRPIFIDGFLKFEVISPDNYRYITDEFGRKVELWIHKIRVINGQPKDTFDIWTKDEFYVMDNNKKIVTPKAPNIYNEIPYLNFKLGADNIYSDNEELLFWELIRAQLDYNKAEIFENNSVAFNGFPIIALMNYDLPADKTFSPGRLIEINGLTDGEVMPYHEQIAPDSQYSEINDLRTKNMKQVLRDYEMPNSLVEEGASVQSGIALEIERKGLEEFRKTDRIQLKNFEKTFINHIAKIATLENSPYTFSVEKDYDVEIEFIETATPADLQVLFDITTAKFLAGIIDAKTYIMTLTSIDSFDNNEEAIKWIKDNKELLKTLEGKEENGNGNRSENTGNDANRNGSENTGNDANNIE